MISPRRQVLVSALGLSDLLLLVTVLYVSILGRDSFVPFSVLDRETVHVHTIAAFAVLVFIWKSTLSLMGFYRSKRLSRASAEIPHLLKGSVAATIGLAIVSFVFRVHPVTFVVLLRFLGVASCALIASRLGMREVLRVMRRRGRNLRQVLIVGTNARAVEFASSILLRTELGYRLEGFVDDVWVGPSTDQCAPSKLVSDLRSFGSYLRDHVVDEVVIALPIKSFYDEEDCLLQTCREHGIIVRVLTDLFDSATSNAELNEAGTAPVVTFSSIPDTVWLSVKRILDIIGAGLLVVIASPIMFTTLILVKLDSEGPAIFTQERIGLNKRRFRIYKFRTMVTNAEKLQAALESSNEVMGPVFKIKNDPRITRIGRFLRKTSIDELPQLFNVLKGEMSLVGPRPLPVRDYTGFNQDWQRRRFSIRPGITCLWQVSGRSSISFDQWMRLDMEYIDSWSLWLDMKILVRTIPAVVKGAGAA